MTLSMRELLHELRPQEMTMFSNVCGVAQHCSVHAMVCGAPLAYVRDTLLEQAREDSTNSLVGHADLRLGLKTERSVYAALLQSIDPKAKHTGGIIELSSTLASLASANSVSSVVLVLENAHLDPIVGSKAISRLLRFNALPGCEFLTVSLILFSPHAWSYPDLSRFSRGRPYFHTIRFPQWTQAELVRILTRHATKHNPMLHETAVALLQTLYPITRDAFDLEANLSKLLPYTNDVGQGTSLHVQLREQFRDLGSHCFEPSFQLSQSVGERRRMETMELTQVSKYLLIASFLASFVPEKRDVDIFSTSRTIRKKRKRTVRAGNFHASGKDIRMKQSPFVLGPRWIPLERVVAVFQAIFDKTQEAYSLSSLYTQIASLISYNLLFSRASKAASNTDMVDLENGLDGLYVLCNVDRRHIRTVAQHVYFDKFDEYVAAIEKEVQ